MDVLRASAELHDGQRNREALPDASARQESSRSGSLKTDDVACAKGFDRHTVPKPAASQAAP